MAYLALYRKYRPVTFDKLIGQEHVVRTLVNQIESGKIGHAYLFCGTRGTGKTSAAKIFSRAINCLSPINGSPCGKCAACMALADPSNIDVTEIDAASNNGVNEIRDLREKIAYPPVSCRYKVYIVDEVHMLSPAAFNALLKTLEEPPKHAVFILATTEVHKLPATILSRCMRFDFRLVPTERIAELISEIYDEVGKEYEPEAVMRIAKAGEGSVRDALSIADICVSYSDGKLTYADVLDALGTSDSEKINELVKYILCGDAGKVLESVASLASLGKGMGLLTKDVVSQLRDILVVKTCKRPNDILCLPPDVYEELKNIASDTSAERLLRAIEVFSAAEADLRYTTHPRVLFETAAIKAARPADDYDISALTARVKTLEDKISAGATAAPVYSAAAKKEEPVAVDSNLAPAADADVKHTAEEAIGILMRGLRQSGELMLWAVMQGLTGELDGGVLTINVKTDGDKQVFEKPENLTAIKKQLSSTGIFDVKFKVASNVGGEEKLDNDIDEIKRIFGDDIVIIK